MPINDFEKVIDLVSMHDVLERYCNIPRSNKKETRIKCPIHQGTHNNFSYTDTVFNCFRCGANGNVISFVMQYFNLSNYDALKKLDEDFNLNVIRSKGKPQEISREQAVKHMVAESKRQAARYIAERREKLLKEYDAVTDELETLRGRMKNTTDLDILSILADRHSKLQFRADELWDEIQGE